MNSRGNMNINLFFRICFAMLLVLGFIFNSTTFVQAQTPEQKKKTKIQPLSDNTRIWTGTAGLRWYNFYVPATNGVEEESNTELNLEFRHIWIEGVDFGWGLQGITQVYMSGAFGNIGLGSIGVGPLARGYPWQIDHWQFYLQGGMLAGYELALADAGGADLSDSMKYRFGLRAGMTHRLSNAFGIYFEIGPDWETESDFGFGSRALQVDIGIQLFRF